MTRVVLDASAVLALLLQESRAVSNETAEELLSKSCVSSVNFAEVRTKLLDLRKLDAMDLAKLFDLGMTIEPFTTAQAVTASDLRSSTKLFGLSLGDRACLALAMDLGLDVYTCDQAWSKLRLACTIHQMREASAT